MLKKCLWVTLACFELTSWDLLNLGLFKVLEAMTGGKNRSRGESAVPLKATISGDAIRVSSDKEVKLQVAAAFDVGSLAVFRCLPSLAFSLTCLHLSS